MTTGGPSSVRPWVLAALAVVSLGIGYGLYFDYKRRADPSFRRKLRKQQKKAASLKTELENASADAAAGVAGAAEGGAMSSAQIDAMLNQPLPTDPAGREKFFMEQLSKGEILAKNGPRFLEPAAACFYLALKVYPAPAELVMLYQKTLAEPVFARVMEMLSEEVKRRQAQYFVEFPPKSMNVKVVEENILDLKPGSTSATATKKRTLVATKAFEPNEEIYTEEPVVTTPEPHYLMSEKYCSHCLSAVADDQKRVSERTHSTYCSEKCEEAAWEMYEQLLYADHASGKSTTEDLVAECAADKATLPILLARFMAAMVHEDMVKTQSGSPEGYGVFDHLERLKYLELLAPQGNDLKHLELLRTNLGNKVPGLDEFLSPDRYLLLKGKFLYNQLGVPDNAPGEEPVPAPEASDDVDDEEPLVEPARSMAPRIKGKGLYPVSAYATHSCMPNAALTFPHGDARAVLVALKPVREGDALTVTWIPNAESEGYDDRSRALSKWRYTCECETCVAEAPVKSQEDDVETQEEIATVE